MREATSFEVGLWRLRESGLTYDEIAARARCSKGIVAGVLYRISHGLLTLPAERKVDRGGCRWVEGDPSRPGWSWCDAPAMPGQAWCPEHRARVYTRGSNAQSAAASVRDVHIPAGYLFRS